MANFKIKLGSNDGKVSFRTVHGASAAAVREHYLKEGYHVFAVNRVIDPMAFFGLQNKIPIKKFLLFNREFKGLVKAGLPIVEGFDILLQLMKKGPLKNLLEQVQEQLTKGESLSKAFAAYEDEIPHYYPALLMAGEQSGNLPEVLTRFIDQEERLRKTRKSFYSAMIYPCFLLAMSFIAMYIILTKAMPQFASLYRGANKELPQLTQMVLNVSDFLVNNYLQMMVLLVLGSLALRFAWTTDTGKISAEKILTRIPVLGKIWRLQNQNIFVRVMHLMLGGGIPIPQALTITGKAVPSPIFAKQLARVHEDVLKGGNMRDGIEKYTFMQEMVAEMVRIGESTGTLEEMLEHLAEYGEEQAGDLMEVLSNVMAPIMLLIIGLIIAMLVIAMYMPMFGATNLF